MFRIDDTTAPGGLPSIVLEGPESRAELVPGRGGLVSRWRVGGDELLHLDEATLADPSKNVRGGIPILFPFAGRLEGDAYELDGVRLSAKQHGFARERAWAITSRAVDAHGATATLELASDDATRARFPRDFRLELAVTLRQNLLLLDFAIENRDERPLPHALGIHPYFRVIAKAEASVATDATIGWDNVKQQSLAVGTPDFAAGELDWHLHDHGLPGTLLRRPPLRPIRLAWSDELTTLVLWTLPNREFVCVEPWCARAGAFPAGDGVRVVAPGETERIRVELSV